MEVSASQSTDVLSQYRQEEASQGTNKELGRNEFLKLLVTQMENQNPLEPQENGDFIAQLAQFSSLEGIENLNTTVSGMATNFQSSQALEATALVGRKVQVETDTAYMFQGELLTGVMNLPSSSPDVTLQIHDDAGALVRSVNLGSQTGGEVDFAWDGTDNDGNPLPSGTYKFTAMARLDGEQQQLSTLLGANVNSVTLGTNGTGTILNLAGMGSMPLSEVRTFQ
ncbi:flagellar hook assembly protein FlgD [Pseudomaricurvus alkylphenolicus]|uniref:flagellar hook assembly protein FlgD n=1 Tax=Pseudomaricurvus alkylphenolicus TaxID=1306991 RepID=UPI00141FE55F|nr:flagellar hook assembly protein FlgD [Pseudomaricurvus alkylphenolicus]NIB43258.1 flagellar hook assembly protein FlgD [Pseudomaricurvus alkylphenolicus]